MSNVIRLGWVVMRACKVKRLRRPPSGMLGMMPVFESYAKAREFDPDPDVEILSLQFCE